MAYRWSRSSNNSPETNPMLKNSTKTFARSWLLLTRSLQVLRDHPRLLLFPMVSFACAVVMTLIFLCPAVFYPSGHPMYSIEHWSTLGNRLGLSLPGEAELNPHAIVYVYVALLYLTSMFLATFFNVAWYNEIMKALSGEAISLRAGLRFAWQRLHSILVWSLFAGVIGLIIRFLEERLGWVGHWVMRAVGIAWSVASVFAIPVIIRNGATNPLTLLRDSATTLRRAWGEALVGYLGITLGSWIILVGSLGFLVGTILLGVAMHAPWLIGSAVVIWLLAMITLGVAASLAGVVYRCALYIYASEGVVPVPYTADMMEGAWKVKKS